ncbi:3'-5' ssDNA/RNA exonuclease TatD-like [Pecten maximus]|uniref:3'-5' ssDNA/RNA exonuclease TatD-like n=1 Tax=Pecten maximus TaxID=6579 RepID=UPI001458EA20|nr:3'-5' ssDNA/RNA exonuclease TatD-like [Pecten maximus]
MRTQVQGDTRIVVSVGLHPHQVGEGQHLLPFLRCLDNSACGAFGEVGIDLTTNCTCRPRCRDPVACRRGQTEGQEVVLTTVLQRAVVKASLPLVLHCRDGGSGQAAASALKCIRQVPGATELVMHWHCFTGSVEQVQEWERYLPNLYLGVTALSLRTEASRRALREHDSGRLLLESDAPYLVPSGAGEGPNTPWLLGHVLRELAGLRGENPGQLAVVLNTNARRVYSLP